MNTSTLRVGSEAARLDIDVIAREQGVASILRLAFDDSSDSPPRLVART